MDGSFIPTLSRLGEISAILLLLMLYGNQTILSHSNRGVSAAGVEGFRNGPRGYFIIIDRLIGTLDSHIRRWRKKQRKGLRHNIKMLARRHSSADDKTSSSGGGDGTASREREEEAGFTDEQVWVGLQISSAMQ